jgi:SAM-dependent methyltransferase
VTAVAAAQLAAWLPERPSRILDLSRAGPDERDVADQIAQAGHQVIRILQRSPVRREMPPAGARVVGDARSLDWFRPASVDAIVAEGSMLSACLAIESTVEDAARLLRPGGRLLFTVDSIVHGLAQLAEQNRWPELADTSAGDVVLVPADQGYTRCFAVSELRELLQDAGFEVEWIRPRTVLPPDVVRHALHGVPLGSATERSELEALVTSELDLAVERQGESLGRHLAVSARLPDR